MNSEIMRDRERVSLAAWNRRDYDAIVENLSPGVVLVDHIRGRKSEGPTSYVARFRPILEAHPDMQAETVSMVVEGNTIVHETVWRGRQTAPLALTPAAIDAHRRRVAQPWNSLHHLLHFLRVDGLPGALDDVLQPPGDK